MFLILFCLIKFVLSNEFVVRSINYFDAYATTDEPYDGIFEGGYGRICSTFFSPEMTTHASPIYVAQLCMDGKKDCVDVTPSDVYESAFFHTCFDKDPEKDWEFIVKPVDGTIHATFWAIAVGGVSDYTHSFSDVLSAKEKYTLPIAMESTSVKMKCYQQNGNQGDSILKLIEYTVDTCVQTRNVNDCYKDVESYDVKVGEQQEFDVTLQRDKKYAFLYYGNVGIVDDVYLIGDLEVDFDHVVGRNGDHHEMHFDPGFFVVVGVFGALVIGCICCVLLIIIGVCCVCACGGAGIIAGTKKQKDGYTQITPNINTPATSGKPGMGSINYQGNSTNFVQPVYSQPVQNYVQPVQNGITNVKVEQVQ